MLEMGVNTPKTFQAPATGTVFFDVRYDDLLVIANHDMGYPALAVDQKTNLATDFRRELGDGLGEFWRDNKGRFGSPAVEIVQAADLVCLESACLSVNLD
jgi:hypothetical protein